MKKETEDMRKWKDHLFSWEVRINITKCQFYQKQSTYSMQIPIKITAKFLTDLERTILNFIRKAKTQESLKNPKIQYNHRTSGGITISDIKLHYRATVLKTACYWHKTDMRTKGTVIYPQTYEQ